MEDASSVAHKGVIESVKGTSVRVHFTAHSACSTCHARGACSLSEVENKYVDVLQTTGDYRVGDEVQVLLERSLGIKAVLYGYVWPLVLLLAVLFGVYLITRNEAVAALSGLSALVPYYLFLYFLRDRINRSFHFTLRKPV